jgi:small-conductance mechanosensitive channel
MKQWLQRLDETTRFFADDPMLNLLAQTALVVFITLVAWLVIRILTKVVQQRLTSIKLLDADNRILVAIRKASTYGLLLVAGTYLIHLYGLQFIERLYPSIFIILMAGPATSILIVVLRYLESRWEDNQETKFDNIIFDLLNKFSGAIVYVVAVILALDVLGINVMPFIAGAGVLGIAVGFAAKDTLSNLIAGILLIIDRPFEMGDRIEVWSAPAGSATWGDVIDIGLRATKIKTTDNIIIVIPNNEIMKRDIVNYTLISSMIRVRINIGVSYDTQIDKAKKVLIDIADKADWIAKNPKPMVVVRNFGESSVDLQLRVWISNARKRIHTISFVTDQAKTAFDQHGIEIPYPKRDIHVITKVAGQSKIDG